MEIERIEQWIGQDVIDVEGEKVGRLEAIYLRGPEPVVAEIKAGRLGRKRLLASLGGASASRDWVRIPVAADAIHEKRSSGDGPDDEDLAAVAAAAGEAPVAASELESSTARDERLAAADEARARAVDLDAEAVRQAQAADDAASRAQAANEDADAARRAREAALTDADRARREAAEAEGR